MTGSKKKAAGKSGTKRTAAKAPASKKAKKTTSTRGNSSRNPLYILIIMGLLAIILVMVNRFYSEHDYGRTHWKKTGTELFRQTGKEHSDQDENNRIAEDKSKNTDRVEENAETAVKVYFLRLNEKTEKFYLTPVKRQVSAGSPLESAISELIQGPSSAESSRGLLTAVPKGLRIRSIRVRNRIAEIDFDESIGKGAAGSVLISRIDQLVYTATQFSRVESVVITVNGRRRKSLGSDGLSIGGPLHRR